MKIIALTGGIALVCAAATPAFAQDAGERPSPSSPPSTGKPTVMTPPEEMPKGAEPPQPTARQVASEVGRDVGSYASRPVNAPRGAFELSVDGGYAQGFGVIQSGRDVGGIAGAGGALGLSLGYRINPRWSVGLAARYAGFGSGKANAEGTTVRGSVASIEGTYHGAPYSRMDPFLTLGAGYRALIASPGGDAPSTITHGFQVAKIEVGLDVRPSESVAIAPVIGADLDMFSWQSGGGTETAAITKRGVSTFVFAGVKGRFDLGGKREPAPAAQIGRR